MKKIKYLAEAFCVTGSRHNCSWPSMLLHSWLLLSMLMITRQPLFAGCDGFGGTGGDCGDNGDVISFTVTNGLVTITRVTGFNGTELIIPTNGLPVVSIAPYAFGPSGVTNVIFPDTLTNIGDHAFFNCASLTGIRIPKSVVAIGTAPFANCVNLPAIEVDPLNSAYSNVDGVLFNQNQTTLLQFPGGKAGNYNIPSSVTNIREQAFYGCTNLTNITIPSSVTSIGDMAFYYCSSLADVTIPSSVTSIGTNAFGYCYGLTSAVVGNGVTVIGEEMFYWCTSLANVTIGSHVTSIGDSAFYTCVSLTNVSLPSALSGIDNFGFGSCSSLTSITLPGNLTSIGIGAFSGCGLTAVSIPNKVSNVESEAFEFCHSLINLTIGQGVTHLGRAAFYECNVTNVTIPDSVEWIEYMAFGFCTNLTTISLGRNVATIEGGAFESSSKLASILVAPFNPVYSSVDGVVFDKNRTTLLLCPEGKSGSYTIPSGVTSIGGLALYQCARLTDVTIPDSVTNIGGAAFSYCYGLTNVTIGTGVTSIGGTGSPPFSGCPLTGVYFRGNAPVVIGTIFESNSAIVYYLPGTSGWSATFAGRPTALWTLPNPIILSQSPTFGVQTNAFGFIISWATNVPIVIEACTNLATPIWSPLATNTLAGGLSYFSDSEWTNHRARVYRVRSQ
jgi:hypothetical protein